VLPRTLIVRPRSYLALSDVRASPTNLVPSDQLAVTDRGGTAGTRLRPAGALIAPALRSPLSPCSYSESRSGFEFYIDIKRQYHSGRSSIDLSESVRLVSATARICCLSSLAPARRSWRVASSSSSSGCEVPFCIRKQTSVISCISSWRESWSLSSIVVTCLGESVLAREPKSQATHSSGIVAQSAHREDPSLFGPRWLTQYMARPIRVHEPASAIKLLRIGHSGPEHPPPLRT